MDLLIYLQMKKVEMKLNYFHEFEKLLQFENQQIKSLESQLIQDRIKLAIKKADINNLASKFKETIKSGNEANHISNGLSLNNLIEANNELKLDSEIRIIELN